MRLRPAISILLITSLILFATSCGGGGGGGNAVSDVFTVNYDANGADSGLFTPEGQISYGDEVVISDNTGNLVKYGYLFDGWNTKADGSGKSYAPGAKYKGENLLLYAKWAAIYLYEVVNGGSPSPALDGMQKVPGTSTLKLVGLTEQGRQLSTFNIPSSMDGYPVTAIGASAFELCTNIHEVTIPESVTSIGDFAFNGCTNLTSLVLLSTTPPTLAGGALDACPVTIAVPISAVDTYKAAGVWDFYSASITGYSNEPHTVTFDSQGATTPASPGSMSTVPPSITLGTLPTAPSKTDHTFEGWFTEPGGAGTEFTASTAVTANMTVYAKWRYNYIVTFNDQGATTHVNPATKTVTEPATTVGSLPAAPEKSFCTFGGWYTQPGGGGTQFTAETTVTGSITVYAKWTLNNMVNISGKTYKMLSTEVTQGLYAAVMGSGPPSYFHGDNLPVEQISWVEAVTFCNALSTYVGLTPVYTINGTGNNDITQDTSKSGFRLPTVEEWQYAAKGGEAYTYAGSNTLDNIAWYGLNSGNYTHPVGTKDPNGYGLYDMTGNVYEWCWDQPPAVGWRWFIGGYYYGNETNCKIEPDDWYGMSRLDYSDKIGFRVICKQ